jgi:hypothetical protein
MSEENLNTIEIGDVVEIDALDWGFEAEQLPATADFTMVRGKLYGQVIVCNRDWITLAPQVFSDDTVRCAISIPWVTVQRVTLLEKGTESRDEHSMIPDAQAGEVDDYVSIKTSVVPVSTFQVLWAGLTSHEELFGASDQINAARDWLNYTMQGREIDDWDMGDGAK